MVTLRKVDGEREPLDGPGSRPPAERVGQGKVTSTP
jgi:hypothetical protein